LAARLKNCESRRGAVAPFMGEAMRKQALILAMLVLATWPQGPAAAEPRRLVTPLAYGTHLPGLGTSAKQLARLVKERSGGALELDLKEPGDGTQPQEILDRVADGSVDAGFATSSLWGAKLSAAPLFSGYPFGPDAQGYLDWFERGNGRALYQEMYDHAGLKLHVMPCAFGGAEAGGWFAKEIKTPDDIKSLRMRIFGLGGRVMARLGATTVLIPGSKLLSALHKGEIDAAELYPPAVDERQGLKDKVKLIYMPGWHQPETVLELIVNKERWNALSPQQRGLIEEACLANLQATLDESAKLQADALTNLAKEGVKIEPWPEPVLAAFRSTWTEIAKIEGERDYFVRTVLDDLEKFREQPATIPAPEPKASAEPAGPAGTTATR
jgi:TRAP-type mannitol/chloroaromatic compound transport system substrate-binding protein